MMRFSLFAVVQFAALPAYLHVDPSCRTDPRTAPFANSMSRSRDSTRLACSMKATSMSNSPDDKSTSTRSARSIRGGADPATAVKHSAMSASRGSELEGLPRMRRRTARTRASNYRGLNGLVT